MNVYSDPEFRWTPFIRPIDNPVHLPKLVEQELASVAENEYSSIIDVDFVKVSATEDSIVYDIYCHDYTSLALADKFPMAKLFRHIVEEGIYIGSCYYVVRIVRKGK